jgi:hypothetical protein
MVVPKLTEDIILKSFEWYNKVQMAGPSIKECVYLLFELFCTRDSLTPRTDSAWPRPKGFKHLVLLGAGTKPGASAEEDVLAEKLVKDGMEFVFGGDVKADIVPNAAESFHDIKAVSLLPS